MAVLLLRHAEAGDRTGWDGDDRARPLTEKGRRQADALVGHLADQPLQRVITSPYVRCVQTVQPLAVARHLVVEETQDLVEGSPLDVVRRLLAGLGGASALLCTHGDVVGAVVTDLHHRGVDVGPTPRWQKAGAWLLTDPYGHATTATYLPPPATPAVREQA